MQSQRLPPGGNLPVDLANCEPATAPVQPSPGPANRQRPAADRSLRAAALIEEIVLRGHAIYTEKCGDRSDPRWGPPVSIPDPDPQIFAAIDTVHDLRGIFTGRCSQALLQTAIDKWVDTMFPLAPHPWDYMIKNGTRRSSRLVELSDTSDEYDDFEP
jgi:hypothetical protein